MPSYHREFLPLCGMRTLLNGQERTPLHVRRHMSTAALKCSFCSTVLEKDTGTAGPGVGICHSCANRAADRLERAPLLDSEQSFGVAKGEVRCSFCFTSTAEDSVLFTRNGYFVCARCIALIRREIIERPLTQAHHSVAGVYPL